MRKLIENKTFDAERSLYNLVDGDVIACSLAVRQTANRC